MLTLGIQDEFWWWKSGEGDWWLSYFQRVKNILLHKSTNHHGWCGKHSGVIHKQQSKKGLEIEDSCSALVSEMVHLFPSNRKLKIVFEQSHLCKFENCYNLEYAIYYNVFHLGHMFYENTLLLWCTWVMLKKLSFLHSFRHVFNSIILMLCCIFHIEVDKIVDSILSNLFLNIFFLELRGCFTGKGLQVSVPNRKQCLLWCQLYSGEIR